MVGDSLGLVLVIPVHKDDRRAIRSPLKSRFSIVVWGPFGHATSSLPFFLFRAHQAGWCWDLVQRCFCWTRCPSGMKGGRAKTGLVRDPTTKEQVRKYEFTLLQSITFHFSWIFILIKIRFLFFLLLNPSPIIGNVDQMEALVSTFKGWTLRLGRFRPGGAHLKFRKKDPFFPGYSEPSSQVNEIWRWRLKLQLPFLGNSKIMVDPQWNS